MCTIEIHTFVTNLALVMHAGSVILEPPSDTVKSDTDTTNQPSQITWRMQ